MKVFKGNVESWEIPESLPYCSDSEFDHGKDAGRQECADELKAIIEKLRAV